MTSTPEWMTPDQLAAESDIPVETIRHHCRVGHITGAVRHGRSWLIPTAAGRRWAAGYIPYGTLMRAAVPTPESPAGTAAASTAPDGRNE